MYELPNEIQEIVRSAGVRPEVAQRVGEGAISGFCSGGDCVLLVENDDELTVNIYDTKQMTDEGLGPVVSTVDKYDLDAMTRRLQERQIPISYFLGALGLRGEHVPFTDDELHAFAAGIVIGHFEDEEAVVDDDTLDSVDPVTIEFRVGTSDLYRRNGFDAVAA